MWWCEEKDLKSKKSSQFKRHNKEYFIGNGAILLLSTIKTTNTKSSTAPRRPTHFMRSIIIRNDSYFTVARFSTSYAVCECESRPAAGMSLLFLIDISCTIQSTDKFSSLPEE